MKHPDGRPWNEKAPIILPDTTLKARFLNGTLTDEDHSHILTLIDKDTAMKPINAKFKRMRWRTCPTCRISPPWTNKYCHECGQKFDWRIEE